MACSEVRMQAVMGQVGLMTDRRAGDADTASGSRADRAMERYADGDEAAFADLYDELAPRILGFALRWTRSRSAAEDAVQQMFLQIHAARAHFVRGGAVLPWAYAIARRLLIDLNRYWAHVVLAGDDVLRPEEPASGPSPEEALAARRAEADLQRDLAGLRPAWREAFVLVKLEGLSVADAAEVLGITPGNVKVRVHRAAKALRRTLAEEPGVRPRSPDLGATPEKEPQT
jgi:RNA polymerase sigma-70 factor (ECF subfamily)